MVPDDPEISRPADRGLRRFGDLVLAIACSGVVRGSGQQPIQHDVIEPDERQVELLVSYGRKFLRKQRKSSCRPRKRPLYYLRRCNFTEVDGETYDGNSTRRVVR